MSAASPPAITASVPSSAPLVPPETGASIHPMPFAALSRAAIARAASGWIEEKSTTSFPIAGDRREAVGAEHHFLDRGGVGDAHEDDARRSSAISRGLAAGFAPASTSAAALPAERFQTVTS